MKKQSSQSSRKSANCFLSYQQYATGQNKTKQNSLEAPHPAKYFAIKIEHY